MAAVLGSEALWSDRDYSWMEGPTDILDGAWTYVRVPLEVPHGAPCPHEGGFRGTVAETATVAICCANHCDAGLNVPVSSDGAVFSEHPGQFSITGHEGAPCTFYETRITPGDYQICCSTCWASGAFFAQPSSTHLSADTTCSPISTNAKLSDAQVNSVAPRRAKIFKLVSPGEDDEPRGEYFLRSTRDYQDTVAGLGLLPVEWARDGWESGDWNAAAGADGTPGSCTAQRLDTECLYGNTCERIFTDYSSAVGCYPDQGQRCFNDGVSCGHQLIEDFEMWVRAEQPLGTGSSSCASIGEAGVFTITPLNVPPFRARCDGDGFMKILQVHDNAYTPTASAFGVSRDAGIDGVVLDLSFDDGALTDSSGTGQTVELVSGAAAYGDGVLGTNAFQFDGTTVLRVAASDSLNLEGGLTQASWVFLDPGANAEMNIMEKGQWSGNWLSHLKVGASSNLQDGEYYFAFASSQFQPVNVDDNVRRLPSATWVHVALTWDGTKRRLFVNGVLDAEDEPTGSLQPNQDPLEIGGRMRNPADPSAGLTYGFVGLMDSIKLFNRALSDEEIAQLAVGRLGSDAILQCNGGSSMVTMTSSHCEEQTMMAHRAGKVLDCRVNEFSCDEGDRTGTHGADEGYCELSVSMTSVRSCFVDRCWNDQITTNGGQCQAGGTYVNSGGSGPHRGNAACCGPWGATSHVAEWQDLVCSVSQTHDARSWVTIANFGPHGINSYDALTAAGWIMHATDDYQVCGTDGSCSGWCPDDYHCTGEDEYASFWCPGACSGSLELPLPSEFNRGRLTIGMHYNNPNCHGSVRVGDVEVYANDGVGSTSSVEFDYKRGDSLVITEQDTCVVEIYRLEGLAANWVEVSKFGPSDINSIESLVASGWTTDNINDFQVCGLSGCTACGQPGSRWCCPDSQPCSGTENYAGFWKGGAGSGTISFALPVGYNKGRLHLGISYSNPNCHGLVTVGGETIFDEVVLVEEHFVEFDCEFN